MEGTLGILSRQAGVKEPFGLPLAGLLEDCQAGGRLQPRPDAKRCERLRSGRRTTRYRRRRPAWRASRDRQYADGSQGEQATKQQSQLCSSERYRHVHSNIVARQFRWLPNMPRILWLGKHPCIFGAQHIGSSHADLDAQSLAS